MVYGIQASKDVKLSSIARSLNKEIALIKTEGRLSRNLGREDLTESINGRLISEGSKRIHQETVIALDLSDLDKPYAEKMEYLAWVRDGSTGETRSKGKRWGEQKENHLRRSEDCQTSLLGTKALLGCDKGMG